MEELRHDAKAGPRPAFRARDVYAVLAALHDIEQGELPAFKAHIYALVRKGLPITRRPGQGREGRWQPRDLTMLAVALELMEMGISSARAVHLIHTSWAGLSEDIVAIGRRWLALHGGELLPDPEAPRRYWRIRLEGIGALRRRDRPWAQGAADRVERLSGMDLVQNLDAGSILDWRHLLIDATRFTEFLLRFLRDKGLVAQDDLPRFLDLVEEPGDAGTI